MVQKLVKYGNSLAVVIPAEVSNRHGFQAGSLVQIMEQDGQLVLCPVEVVPKLSEGAAGVRARSAREAQVRLQETRPIDHPDAGTCITSPTTCCWRYTSI